jgi:hypothetical protein
MVENIKQEDSSTGFLGQKQKPCVQNDQTERAGVVAQVVEHLPSNREAIVTPGSSNPSNTNNDFCHFQFLPIAHEWSSSFLFSKTHSIILFKKILALLMGVYRAHRF